MIGKTIKRLRVASGISKSELARRIKVSATAVHNWEEYGVTPRDAILPTIAGALGVSVQTLTGRSHAPVPRAAAAKDSAAAIIEYKGKIAELFGVQPSQVSISIAF